MGEQADLVRHVGYGIIGVGLLVHLVGILTRRVLIFASGFAVVLVGSIVASVSHLILGAGIGAFLLGVIFGPIMVYLLVGFLFGSVLIGGCFIGLFPNRMCNT